MDCLEVMPASRQKLRVRKAKLLTDDSHYQTLVTTIHASQNPNDAPSPCKLVLNEGSSIARDLDDKAIPVPRKISWARSLNGKE